MYRRNARRDYLNLAKCKKRTTKKIRKAVKQQLQYIRRDMGYGEAFVSDGVELTPKQEARLSVVCQVYEQQQYMYENNTHTVPERIVSISQPYIRPIVRGKAAAPVEFGAKLDLSIDENGMARLERLSFDAYNESDVLIGAIERYKERTLSAESACGQDLPEQGEPFVLQAAWHPVIRTGAGKAGKECHG